MREFCGARQTTTARPTPSDPPADVFFVGPTTFDGGRDWNGPVGFIHNVLHERYLKSHPAPEDIEYYLCGPGPMNKAVIAMLISLGADRENILLDDFG